MCKYYSGTLYEPPSWDICDQVYTKADQLAKEAGYASYEDVADDKVADKFMDDATELVHPQDVMPDDGVRNEEEA